MKPFLIVFGAFFLMEMVAWFTHKYIMHGILWRLHRDHHVRHEDRFFEKNDLFFLLFALPGILLLILGSRGALDVRFWIGAGISLYGLAYFLVHDVFIHRRIGLTGKTKNFYLRALRKAHMVHHKKQVKEGGRCFGMLWVPLRYFRKTRPEHTD